MIESTTLEELLGFPADGGAEQERPRPTLLQGPS